MRWNAHFLSPGFSNPGVSDSAHCVLELRQASEVNAVVTAQGIQYLSHRSIKERSSDPDPSDNCQTSISCAGLYSLTSTLLELSYFNHSTTARPQSNTLAFAFS